MNIDLKVQYRTKLATLWARAMCMLAPVIGGPRALRWAHWGVRRFARWRVVEPKMLTTKRWQPFPDPHREPTR